MSHASRTTFPYVSTDDWVPMYHTKQWAFSSLSHYSQSDNINRNKKQIEFENKTGIKKESLHFRFALPFLTLAFDKFQSFFSLSGPSATVHSNGFIQREPMVEAWGTFRSTVDEKHLCDFVSFFLYVDLSSLVCLRVGLSSVRGRRSCCRDLRLFAHPQYLHQPWS